VPTTEGIADAHRRIRLYLSATPLVRAPLLSARFGADLWIKNETTSPVASFKARGALTELLRAAQSTPVRRAVTSSTGNHGQGVAYAAQVLELPSTVFLPVGANPVKRAMIRSFGAEIVELGADIDEAKAHARAFASERGAVFVDDGEGLGVMEGAGTVGLEIAEALPDVDALFVPMGSGTLAAGCAAAVKAHRPGCRVVAVQAAGAPAMVESFHARRAIERPVATLADGLACRVPADRALRAILAYVDDAVLAADDVLLAAVHTLAIDAHVLAEPAGAAALAAAWNARGALRGQRVVVVVSGANVTADVLALALAMPPLLPAA
jgi:threonine dehydratase